MKDPELIEQLRGGKRTEVIGKLYQHFPKIRSLVIAKGGSAEDARDVFQEALLIFCKKAMKPEFELTSSAGTYLYSVSRFLWKDQLVKENRLVPWEPDENAMPVQPQELELYHKPEEKANQLDSLLRKLGERCFNLLKLYYFEKLSMRSIAEAMGFGSDRSAKTQKYKCLERARKMAESQFAHLNA